MKAKISTLWVIVLLNMLFRDIHEIATPEFLAETMTQIQPTEELFLLAAIVLEIPIAMIFLSRVLKYGINRWANIVTGLLMIVLIVVNNTAPDLDDLFFATMEIAALMLIGWLAWKWQNDDLSPDSST